MITADLLYENFTAIDDWTDADGAGGVSTVASGWLDQSTTGASAFSAKITRDIGTIGADPTFTVEFKTKFTALDNVADGYFLIRVEAASVALQYKFAADGLFQIYSGGTSEIGTNIVKTDGTEQLWQLRLLDHATSLWGSPLVYLDGVQQTGGSIASHAYSGTDGLVTLNLVGSVASKQSYLDELKIGTGSGNFGAAVTTAAATSVTHNSCTGNGTVTMLGTNAITAKGICYVKGTGTPTIADSTAATTGNTLGAYTVSITGLDYNSTYTARAYTTTADGTSYGSSVTITTETEASMAVMFF